MDNVLFISCGGRCAAVFLPYRLYHISDVLRWFLISLVLNYRLDYHRDPGKPYPSDKTPRVVLRASYRAGIILL